jgi:hypothetical protein
MTWILSNWKLVSVILLLVGIEQYGEHRIQAKWNLETAHLEALATQAKEQSAKANQAVTEQHRKDIENAKSEAGKYAIRDYLRTHGMLHTEGSSGQAQSSGVPDESPCQCGTGASIEEFAGRCAQDSMTILEWQDWSVREGLETE